MKNRLAPLTLLAGSLICFQFGVANAEILPHPQGCPSSNFCGCGLCVKLFGHPCVRGGLAIASNWRKQFPRTQCASGMVATWSSHVAYIEACNGDGTAALYDPNSGGRQTRRHVRDISSAIIVDPNGNRSFANTSEPRMRQHSVSRNGRRHAGMYESHPNIENNMRPN